MRPLPQRPRRRWLAVLFVCASATGCGRSAAPPSAVSPSAAPSAGSEDNDSASTVPTDASCDSPLGIDEQRVAGESDECRAAQSELAEKIEPERLILLTRDRMLIVHLEIWIDGQPQRSAIERRLDVAAEAAAAADDDTAGDPAWSKVVADSKFVSGVFGNVPDADAAARTRAIEQFDFNRDDHVQRDELAAFLAQGVARGRPFAANWVADGGAQEPWNSPLYILLDVNGDALISTAEMAAAATRLRSRDVNDDDALTLAELRPPQRPNRNRRYARDARLRRAFELHDVALESIYYTLCDLYGSAGGLDGDASAQFAALDTDRSGVVDEQEIAGLPAALPDLLVKVEFASQAEGGASPSVTVLETSDDLKSDGARMVAGQDRLVIELPDSRVAIFALDATGAAEPAAVAAELFAKFDADKNDVIDETELADADDSPEGRALGAIGLEIADTDGDGKLTLEEVRAALEGRAPYRNLQVQVRASETGDPLFSWLDVRPDGRLTSRELAGAADRLAQLDSNGDDVIAPGEVPHWILCAIVRGASDTNAMTPPTLPVRPSNDTAEAPPWLAAMDRNGDGEVSRREFLGTAEQFGRMDANTDGFVDADEATRVPPTGDSADDSRQIRPDVD